MIIIMAIDPIADVAGAVAGAVLKAGPELPAFTAGTIGAAQAATTPKAVDAADDPAWDEQLADEQRDAEADGELPPAGVGT